MLTIETKLDPLEINGEYVTGLPAEKDQFAVKAHWNINRLVVLEWRGQSITVSASQLEKAIANARNHDH